MYRAKEQGRNTFRFLTAAMNARSLARLTMEKYPRRALAQEELMAYYQPKVNLSSGRMPISLLYELAAPRNLSILAELNSLATDPLAKRTTY
jgi:predicted signal transduction protein with EAL and GGDEF domain